MSPEDRRFVEEQVGLGRYSSVGDAVREAIDGLRQREAFLKAERAHIEKLIDEGFEQAQRGELLDGEECFRAVEERYRDRLRQAKKPA